MLTWIVSIPDYNFVKMKCDNNKCQWEVTVNVSEV